ncbi:hypothetical protein GCM10009122_35110 [Fulvivirga kasyanovii]|uniref:DUF481 domain-containing protein n=1 Tax=Fulvivirga kasyanovii TaxID=396812 RepID=A0ABW9RNL0_9BACT|nr:DUF481 domain-containing protein [Fulvivirga kasyanovii]MTI25506.1 DUF481 domain-containing protein [Fulvivirga kasyanovii]
MKKSVFVLALIFTTLNVSAQILKVDKGSIDSDSSNYFMGNINFNFNLNNRSATAEKEITFTGLEANADIVYVAEKHAYILINKINYFKSTGGPLISTGYAHFRVNFLRKRIMSYELFSQIQYDDGRMMPLRFLQGGGLKFRLSSTEKSKIYLGIGGMYEEEHWKSVTEEDVIIEKELWKTSDYINGKFNFNDHVSFDVILYYQGGYDGESEVFRNRFSGDAVLSMQLTDKLSFLTSFSAQYEDKPIIPINNFVYSLTNGLKWSF